MDYPQNLVLDSPYGMILVSVPRGDYVYVDAMSNGKFLSYRGKKYAVSVRLQSYDEGHTWKLMADTKGRTYEAVYAKKYQHHDNDDAMPATFTKVVVDEIIDRVTVFIHSNLDLLHLAAVVDANNRLAAAEERLTEMRGDVEVQEGAVYDLTLLLKNAEAHRLGR